MNKFRIKDQRFLSNSVKFMAIALLSNFVLSACDMDIDDKYSTNNLYDSLSQYNGDAINNKTDNLSEDTTVKNKDSNLSSSQKLMARVESFKPAQDDPYPGFRFNTEELDEFFQYDKEDLLLNKKAEVQVKIIDELGNNINNIKWYFMERYPNKRLLTKEQTQESNQDSIITINNHGITARKEGNGHLLAVYQDQGKEYIHKLNVTIRSENGELQALQNKQVQEKATEIIKDIMYLSDFAKVKYIHDYLAENITYDDNHARPKNPYYYALVKKTAVCDGYAWSFVHLSQELGLNSERITGYAGSQYHAWNRVELEDGWYYVDVTWDDDHYGNSTKYNYFLLNKEIISKDHATKTNDSGQIEGTKYTGYPYIENFNIVKDQSNLDETIKNIADRLENGQQVSFLAAKDSGISNVANLFSNSTLSYINTMSLPKTTYRNYDSYNFKVNFSNYASKKYIPIDFSLTAENYNNGFTTENILIKLDKNVTLGLHNIDIENAAKVQLTPAENNTYKLKITDIQPNQEVKIKIVKTGYKFPDEFKSVPVNVVKADMPEADFIGISYKSGKFINAKDGDMYNIGDGKWHKLENNKEVDIKLESFILIKHVELGKVNSDFQKITFRKQESPDWIKADGHNILGINSKMEYKLVNTNEWKSITSNTLTLDSGTYEFRFTGKKRVLGSYPYTIKVE